MELDALVAIGMISKPQGIRGEVRLRLSSIPIEAFETLKEIYLQYPEGKTEKFLIDKKRVQKDFIVTKFRGIDDRNQAEKVRDCIVQIPSGSLPSLPEGEYYDFQLVGLSVFTDTGTLVGELIEIWNLPANDVYVVAGENDREYLIPVIEAVIREIDLEKGAITIFPMEGLLD